MQCPLIIIALSCAINGQPHLPLLTRLLQPTLSANPPHVDLYGTLKLTPPPPPPHQPKFSPSPRYLPSTSSESRNFAPAPTLSDATTFPETTTSSSHVLFPTTIKFTLDDVSAYFHPELNIPPHANVNSPEGSLQHDAHIIESPSEEVPEEDSVFSATVINEEPAEYQWILTSSERVPLKSDRQELNDSETDFEEPFPVISENEEGFFLPSLSFPFPTDAIEEPPTQTPVVAERFVAAASNLQSQPLHFVESGVNIFSLKPIKIETEDYSESKTLVQGIENKRPLSKTPVPQVVDLSEEKDNSVEERVNESSQTRRVLQFDQEFLSLLKSHSQENEKNKTAPFSPDKKHFWLDEGLGGKADLAERLKIKLPTALFSTFEPSKAPKTEKSSGGVFTTSLRGLTSTTASSVQLSALEKISKGPKIVPVGEVGEVLHEEQDSGDGLEAPLSAVFRHGVQSINVSTWVSGCPKLYGKVTLNCAVHHDSLAKATTTLRWKKKTFAEGHVEEQVITEDGVVVVEDPRLSLHRRGGQYNLHIKDFRAKDCGSYECEGRAADTIAASQLLLFTCH